jgi:hypothetical protein
MSGGKLEIQPVLAPVAVAGMVAAVALPSFMKNARMARTTEATLNVKKIVAGAVAAYE